MEGSVERNIASLIERFNQWYLGDKLGVKSNNLSAFFRGIQKKAYGTYMIVQ